ncbi:MAG TPA: hypothetical protein VK157_09350 [Phycisphaerales bacterium]|nr:hypothetical protein [Phycisphaerales bacterium]
MHRARSDNSFELEQVFCVKVGLHVQYKVVTSKDGKQLVKFKCPRCGIGLDSDLQTAGSNDICPECDSPFVVPGIAERDAVEAEARRRLQQREKQRREAQVAANARQEAQALEERRRQEEQAQEAARVAQERLRFEAEHEAEQQAAAARARAPATSADIAELRYQLQVLNASVATLSARLPGTVGPDRKEVSDGVLKALAKWTLLPLAVLPGLVMLAVTGVLGPDESEGLVLFALLLCFIGGVFVLVKTVAWANLK